MMKLTKSPRGRKPQPKFLVNEEGQILKFLNLKKFAIENGLSYGNLYKVVSGKLKSSYGLYTYTGSLANTVNAIVVE